MNDLNFLKNNKIDVDKSVNELGLDMYNELLGVFLTEIFDKVNKLQTSLQTNNMQDYSTYVHGIKGESLYLGFTELARQALEHQTMSEQGNFEYIKNNFIPLITEISRVIKVARIYLGKE